MSQLDPALSVVVPTYRRIESLARTLRALGAQDLRGIEIVVVDQNPAGFLDEALAAFDVRHVRQEEPNASSARNLGFVRSSGARVLFLDDDLVPHPRFCREVLSLMDSHPEVRCVIPALYDDDALTRPAHAVQFVGRHAARPDLGWVAIAMSAAIAFDREYFRDSGGFDELLFRHARAGEDHELVHRMALRGQRVWLDRRLRIFHDEGVPGGAEMRTVAAAESRRRAIWSWVLRERCDGASPPNLDVLSLLRLCRVSFLNRRRIGRPSEMLLGARILRDALRESREILRRERPIHAGVLRVDHLARYAGHEFDGLAPGPLRPLT